jgi:hypothetical protein
MNIGRQYRVTGLTKLGGFDGICAIFVGQKQKRPALAGLLSLLLEADQYRAVATGPPQLKR